MTFWHDFHDYSPIVLEAVLGVGIIRCALYPGSLDFWFTLNAKNHEFKIEWGNVHLKSTGFSFSVVWIRASDDLRQSDVKQTDPKGHTRSCAEKKRGGESQSAKESSDAAYKRDNILIYRKRGAYTGFSFPDEEVFKCI